MFAAIGSDGTRLVVWGLGRTEKTAEKEALDYARSSDVDPELQCVVSVTASQLKRIRSGEVSVDSLGIALAGRGVVRRAVAGEGRRVAKNASKRSDANKMLSDEKSYSIAIKTAPHQEWNYPQGWGPYRTRNEAERALVQADAQWMAARIVESAAEPEEAQRDQAKRTSKRSDALVLIDQSVMEGRAITTGDQSVISDLEVECDADCDSSPMQTGLDRNDEPIMTRRFWGTTESGSDWSVKVRVKDD